MGTVGHTLESGVVVFEIPESLALGDLVEVRPSAEGGLPVAEKIVAELKDHLAKGGRKFVFDLSRLNYIDSAGVGIIVSCWKMIVDAGGKVQAVTPESRVRNVLNITKITDILPLHDDLDTALTMVSGE